MPLDLSQLRTRRPSAGSGSRCSTVGEGKSDDDDDDDPDEPPTEPAACAAAAARRRMMQPDLQAALAELANSGLINMGRPAYRSSSGSSDLLPMLQLLMAIMNGQPRHATPKKRKNENEDEGKSDKKDKKDQKHRRARSVTPDVKDRKKDKGEDGDKDGDEGREGGGGGPFAGRVRA